MHRTPCITHHASRARAAAIQARRAQAWPLEARHARLGDVRGRGGAGAAALVSAAAAATLRFAVHVRRGPRVRAERGLSLPIGIGICRGLQVPSHGSRGLTVSRDLAPTEAQASACRREPKLASMAPRKLCERSAVVIQSVIRLLLD
jgi:hypothetical protein